MPVLIPAAPPSPPSTSSLPLQLKHVMHPVPRTPTCATSQRLDASGHLVSSDSPVAVDLDISFERRNLIPTLDLDSDSISDVLASRLAMRLLEHVLFLKGQIPMPIKQLPRLRSSSNKPRATKLRTELLDSLDILSSHLDTTLTHLSTMLSLSRSSPCPRKACLAFLIGPSIGAPKCKIFCTVDGFEVRNAFAIDENEDDEDIVVAEERLDGQEEDLVPVEVDDEDLEDRPSPPPLTPPQNRRLQHPPPSPQSLRETDHLLSRTLARDFSSLSDELAPTQTHILLLAPRRFSHPSWTPKQNLTSSLGRDLAEFENLADSGSTDPDGLLDDGKTRTRGRSAGSARSKLKVEGLRIRAAVAREGDANVDGDGDGQPDGKDSEEIQEDDELIWWCWNGGKILGFNEW